MAFLDSIPFLDLPRTLWRKAREYWRELWVRVVLMGTLAFVALGVAVALSAVLPDDLSSTLAGEAADRLLMVIANAMLAVTTFSLTVMVTVFFNASAQWTPRVHRVAMADNVTQHTLATFIGAYVYALVGIILRELNVFSDEKALVLFVMTCAVLAFVVWSLIRWTLHLQTFGSLLDSTRQTEDVARREFRKRYEKPCLGANPFTGDAPGDTEVLRAQQAGYVQHVYEDSLNAFCGKLGVEMWLLAEPGKFISYNAPLVRWREKGEPEEETERDLDQIVRDHIILGDVRTHEQDPLFGLVVLSEIGSKALSPGVNDPGTAIDVLTRMERILTDFHNEDEEAPTLTRLHIPPLNVCDLIHHAFQGISRDGAGEIEVQIHLQKALAGLMDHPEEDLRCAAKDMAEEALARALQTLTFEPDHDRLRKAAHPDVAGPKDA
ncbi:MAG: DUF2254 domain-containing protein [Shimia sp.]